MSNRIELIGNTQEKIVQALKCAGWYAGRKVDISQIEDYYKRFGLQLSNTAKAFFQEYYGICNEWYIEVTNFNYGADFQFDLFPYPSSFKTDVVDFMYDDAENILKSKEYKNALNTSQEDSMLVMVGEIGYYYPARVWIGKAKKLYATHEYEDAVRMYDSLLELIEYELKGRKFDSVGFKCIFNCNSDKDLNLRG